jgi:hypothetical protein
MQHILTIPIIVILFIGIFFSNLNEDKPNIKYSATFARHKYDYYANPIETRDLSSGVSFNGFLAHDIAVPTDIINPIKDMYSVVISLDKNHNPFDKNTTEKCSLVGTAYTNLLAKNTINIALQELHCTGGGKHHVRKIEGEVLLDENNPFKMGISAVTISAVEQLKKEYGSASTDIEEWRLKGLEKEAPFLSLPYKTRVSGLIFQLI